MKQKDFLIILIPAVILSILWVIFSIYHNLTTSTIKDPLTFQIIPIEGKFDTETINKLKEKQRINPLFNIVAGETTPTPIPESSLIEEITPTESFEEITPTTEKIPSEGPIQ